MKNLHSQSIPADTLAQADQMIDDVYALLTPYLTSLKPDERMNMPKIGEKGLSFVEKSGELCRNNPKLRPAFLDMEDFQIDLADALALRSLLNKLHQLTNGIDDTMMLAGSEAYIASLVFYSAVANAAKNNVAGAKAVHAELKKRFPGRSKSKAEKQTEEQTEQNK